MKQTKSEDRSEKKKMETGYAPSIEQDRSNGRSFANEGGNSYAPTTKQIKMRRKFSKKRRCKQVMQTREQKKVELSALWKWWWKELHEL